MMLTCLAPVRIEYWDLPKRKDIVTCEDSRMYVSSESFSDAKLTISTSVPDLAFSEMKFLSKKSQITHIESATRHAERKDGQHVDRAQNKAADYDTRFTERTGTPRSTEKRSLLLSEAFEPNLQHSPPPRNGRHPPGKYTFGQTKDRHPPNDAGDLHCERKRKRSSSPFSESKFAGSGEIYEYCLKELLSVYPMIQQESPTSTRSIRYWDLDELKSLLEERKRLWDSHHRVITVYDDDPSCERIVKRRRLLHCDPEEFNPRYSEFSTQMVQGTPARYHKNRGLRETAPIPESPPLPSPLLPLSTHRRADLNKQTNQEELHGSPESVAENVELGHFHSSFGRNPRDVTYPVISPNGHLYTPPQYHISTDVDAGVPIYESELSWIDTHYPAHLHGDPPEPEYDQDLLMQYIDAGFLGITPPDLEYIAQQSPLEDINGDMFEEFKEDMLKQGNTVTTILIPDEPRPSIEQPHRPTIEELYSESEEPGGFIGRGQYRARSQSPHFVRPPLPGEVLQIREVEDIRARDPQPGIPRPLSIDRGSHARVDDEIPGFWRENKLY